MIDYRFVRQWLLFFTPYFFICTLPSWLGITQIAPDWATFRFWFDNFIAWCFFSGVAYLVYAIAHNAKLKEKNT